MLKWFRGWFAWRFSVPRLIVAALLLAAFVWLNVETIGPLRAPGGVPCYCRGWPLPYHVKRDWAGPMGRDLELKRMREPHLPWTHHAYRMIIEVEGDWHGWHGREKTEFSLSGAIADTFLTLPIIALILLVQVPGLRREPRRPSIGLRFSLGTLISAVVLFCSCGGLWYRWEPWRRREIIDKRNESEFTPAFSLDTLRVVAGSKDKPLRVLSALSGQDIMTVEKLPAKAWSAAFHPDGKHIITGEVGRARTWKISSGRETAVLQANGDVIYHIWFSANGRRMITWGASEVVDIWDAVSAKLLTTIRVPGTVLSARISGDGRWFVAKGAGSPICVWDAETGEKHVVLEGGHTKLASCLAFSPDSERILTAGHDGTAIVWHVGSGSQVMRLLGHAGRIESVRFSPDGRRILTASADGTARVWDAKSGMEQAVLARPNRTILYAVFSPDGTRIATVDLDGDVCIWDVRTGRRIAVLEHRYRPDSLLFSPDGQRIAGVCLKTAFVWDRRHPEYWWGIAWLPEFWVALASGLGLVAMAIRRLRHRSS